MLSFKGTECERHRYKNCRKLFKLICLFLEVRLMGFAAVYRKSTDPTENVHLNIVFSSFDGKNIFR